MMEGWTVVFKTTNYSRAEIVKGILTELDITAVIINKKDNTLHMYNGQIEVLVQNADVMRALKIVENEISFE